jgi:glycosyltransferase involved in cell wall biosynthesis
MRFLINVVGINISGGMTYATNTLRAIARIDRANEYFVFVAKSRKRDYAYLPENFHLLTSDFAESGTVKRVLWDQLYLRWFVRKHGIDYILALANFGLILPPVPELLFLHNPVYFSEFLLEDVMRERDYRWALAIWVKRWYSILGYANAHRVVCTSRAIADDLSTFVSLDRRVTVSHQGFDRENFMADTLPMPSELRSLLTRKHPDELLMLYVSAFTFYKNYETVFRAVPFLNKKLGRPFRVFVTLRPGRLDAPDAARARKLLERPEIGPHVVNLGFHPYPLMHRIYGACDVSLFPSYLESFGHPMLEGLAAGLPVVAAGTRINREICGDAALYFDTLDAEALADRIVRVAGDAELADEMRRLGTERVKEFSWDAHARHLLERVTGRDVADVCGRPAG